MNHTHELITMPAILMLAVVIFAGIFCSRRETSAPFSGDRLTVMTINVWSGLDYRGTLIMGEYENPGIREKRYQALLGEIRRLSPDIIGINEANFLPDYVERLASDLDYDFIFHVGVSGARVGRVGVPWNLREGDALLARRGMGLELVGRKHLSGGGFVANWASFHTEDATQVLVGSVNAGWRKIFVAVTHLHASPEDSAENREFLGNLAAKTGRGGGELETAMKQLKDDNDWRAGEIRALIAYLAKRVPKGAPLILLGDFNAMISSPEMKPLTEAGYLDTYALHLRDDAGVVDRDHGFTWDPQYNLNLRKYYPAVPEKESAPLYEHLSRFKEAQRSRIDFIFLNSVFSPADIISSSVCAQAITEDIQPSDHFGVVTTLRLADEDKAGK